MNGQLRREKIIDILSRSDKPVSGVALAKQLDVSPSGNSTGYSAYKGSRL